MPIKKVHIIGAGITGLSSAVYLKDRGIDVSMYEASPFAGGRCRSYFDEQLAVKIDNGNHLVLSANKETISLIKKVGSLDKFISSNKWPFPKASAGFSDYLKSFNILFPANRTVEQCLSGTGELYKNLWQPLAVSVLNTPAEIASARTFSGVFKKIIFNRTAFVPRESWGESLIEPMVKYIGGEIEFTRRIKSLSEIGMKKDEAVIVAVPPHRVSELIEGITAPANAHAIVNVHFKYDHSETTPFIGVIDGTAQWLFFRTGIISTTTSAADKLVEKSEEEIAERIWQDVKKALDINGDIPPFRVIKEKRATFSATDENLAKRPSNKTGHKNVFIAGDYTDTGLPATIESAVVSGKLAAEAVISA